MKKLLKILVSVLILFLLISSFTPVTFAGDIDSLPTNPIQPKDQIWYTVTVSKTATGYFNVPYYSVVTGNFVGECQWTCSVHIEITYRWNWVTGQWQYAYLYYNVGAGPSNTWPGFPGVYYYHSLNLNWYATGYAGSQYRSANGIYRPFDPLHAYDGSYHLVWQWSANYPNPPQAGQTIYVQYYNDHTYQTTTIVSSSNST